MKEIQYWWGCGTELGTLFMGYESLQTLYKTVWWYSINLNRCLLYDPEILFLGIYPKRWKPTSTEKLIHVLCIEASFTIVKIWKLLKCPSTVENSDIFAYTMEYYTAMIYNYTQYEWITQTAFKQKKPDTRIYTAWFHLYKVENQ